MFYLVLAILSSTLISIFMRISEKYLKNQMAMFMANYAVCMLLSILFMTGERSALQGQSMKIAVVLGILSGVLYLGNFMLLQYNMKHNGIVLSSTFMKLGVLIPTVMAIVLFREVPGAMQILGIVLALAAIIMIHFEKGAVSEGNKKFWLLVLLLGSGITDSMANIYEQFGTPERKNDYLLLTFLTAFLIALIFAVCNKRKISGKDILFGILIGIPNYFSARFLLLALGEVEAVIVYPTYSIGTLIAISLAGVIGFHENLSRKKLCALGLIVVALGLLNLA